MSFKELFGKIGIKQNEKDLDLTAVAKKAKTFTKVKDNITLKQYHNYSADLLFLPETDTGFKYLLVVVDLATDLFDIEPLPGKKAASVLTAFKKMFRRQYIKKPKASVSVDDGSEFKGEFAKYLTDQSIFKKTAVPGRHTQNSTVESLNRQLGRLFNEYMNSKEIETEDVYKEWDNVIKIVRKELNKYRKKTLPVNPQYKWVDTLVRQKFNVGDIVHALLDKPKNALGQTLKDEKFRSGDYRWDPVPKKIVKIFQYPGAVPYRYQLEGKTNVSYTPQQLKISKDKAVTESKFIVKQLLEKKKIRNRIHYLVHWKNYLKKDATWEPATQLKQDGFGPEIKEFNKK